MDAPTSLHPTDQTLHAYGLGKLDDASSGAVYSHLEGCPDCRRRTAEMTSDSFLGRFQGAQSANGPDRRASTQSPVDTLPPELADHKDYEVVRELGRGGMGVVYLVRNRLMGRNEVLKVMGRHLVERPEVSERFLREIRAVASLRHPNIVAAHHAFHVGGSIAFTMEYVDGYDLSKMVKSRGPLPVAHACLFAHQAAQGLQHAHEEGMVHRDIKPGNLMVARRGEKAVVKVLDFGLAKAVREGDFDGALTHAGQMLGTPDYIAPEQIVDAQSADIRADIYSLGCTLYYLLTGGPPFHATSLYDLLQAHHSTDARPLNLTRPEVPTELAALVAKMMAKEPERRFQTPAEVSQALTPFTKKGAAAPRPAQTDISLAGGTRAHRTASPGESALPRTADKPRRSPENRTQPDAPGPDSMWASLIDLHETEPSPRATAPPLARSVPPRKPPRIPRPAIAAASLFGALALGIIIYISINKDRVDVSIRRDGDGPPAPPGQAEAAPPPSPPFESSKHKAILDKLAMRVPMHFPKETPLEDVLKYVAKATGGPDGPGFPIYADPVGLEEAEKSLRTPVIVDVEGIPLAEALYLALDPHELVCQAVDDFVIISSRGRIKSLTEGLARPRAAANDRSPETARVLAELARPIRRTFPKETPLQAVLDSVADATTSPGGPATQKNLDALGLQQAEKSPQFPVVMALEGVPLGTAFWLALNEQGLDYGVKERLLYISTPERVARYLGRPAPPAPKPEPEPEPAPQGEPPPAAPVVKEDAVGGTGGSPTSVSKPSQALVGKPPVPPAAEKGTKPVPLTELNTPGIDADAWVSPDGLQIYWTSEPTGAARNRAAFAIYRAERPDPSSPFGAKRLLIQNGQHPTLTPDQLQIVYLQDAGTKYKQIVVRSRPSVRDQFGPASSPGDFGPYVAYNSPAISADGLSLTVNAKATDDILSTVYLTTRRKTTKDAWSKPEMLNISWDTRAEKAPLSWIAMAPDELSFLATHELELGRFRVVRFSRDRISEPFRRFRYLTLPDGNPIYGRSPRYIATTDELYLTALPVYAQSAGRELWAKTKPDLWVIRDFGQGQGWASDN